MRTYLRLLLVLSLSSVGCYQSHGLEQDDSGVRPAVDASPADTARPPVRDSGVDPLPPEPEVDFGPDARPSDYPEAAGWQDPDPAAYPDDEPCCTLIGEEQTLEMGGDGAIGSVTLEWSGRKWGMLFTNSERTLFIPLEPLGQPGTRRLLPTTHNLWGDLAWGGGRFGVALSTEAGELSPQFTARFMLIDELGTLASEVTTLYPAYRVKMARMTHLDRWATAFFRGPGDPRGTGQPRQIAVQELDGAARISGEPALISPGDVDSEPGLVGLKSRIVAFYGSRITPGGDPAVMARTLTSPFVASPTDAHVVLERTRSFHFGTAPFRNTALVADLGPVALRIAAFEPFVGSVTARGSIRTPVIGPLSIDGMNLAASDGKGLVALCIPTDDRDPALGMDSPVTIELFLFGANLQPLGLPIDVGQIADPGSIACEVGFSDDNILVAWWDRNVPVVHVRAVRP